MKYTLQDYVKVYRGIISKEVCDSTITELKVSEFSPHTFYSHISDSNILHDNNPDFFIQRIPSSDEIMKSTWNALSEYVGKDIAVPWFTGWGGYSSPKFLSYDVNSTMQKHCDHIHDMFTDTRGIPALSVIGVLNNEFTGGDLIFFDDTNYNLQAGDLVVFPSNFLFPHEVKPVITGKRYSFASFVW